MRLLKKALTVVSVGAVGLGVIAAVAGAGSITTPPTDPFTVPGDAAGNPKPFTISASGFDPNATVTVEQCDGTPADAVGWSPTTNCDLGSSPAAQQADASGNVTFDQNDINHAFHPFKGASPQGLFNCLAPGQADPNNGLPSFANCQLRVSTNLTTATSDQDFRTMTLPSAVASKDALGNIACSATVQETIKPGVQATYPKPPKSFTVKTLKQSAKKLLQGSVLGALVPGGSCDNSGVVGGKYPITAGTIQIKDKTPAPWNCSNLLNPTIDPKNKVQVKWEGVNPKNGKLASVGTSKTLITNITVNTSPVLAFDVVTAPIAKGAFTGDKLVLHLVSDKTASQLQNDCNSTPGGVVTENFTGVNGPSTIAAQP